MDTAFQSAVFGGQTWIMKRPSKPDPSQPQAMGLHSDSHGIPPGGGNIAHMCNASILATGYELMPPLTEREAVQRLSNAGKGGHACLRRKIPSVCVAIARSRVKFPRRGVHCEC